MISAPPAVPLANGFHRPAGGVPMSAAPTSVSDLFAAVAPDIAATERVLAGVLAPYTGPVADIAGHMRHYRGKRLRPALVFLAARAVGEVTPAHHTLAAVVEMVHTATLVHDDVLDDASTRRHVRTVNAEWGNKASILFGDLLFTHSFHLASTVDGRACQLIGAATNRVCSGELKQVCERGNLDLSERDYFAILDGKTAALTEVSTRIGAVYAGATDATADRLAAYGRNLGMAFQVADDLLDLSGDEAKAGKTLGTDLDQQKLTLPVIHALQTLPAARADELRALIRSDAADKPTRVLAALKAAGSLAYAKRRADEFARAARAALTGLPRTEARAVLEALPEWAVRREK